MRQETIVKTYLEFNELDEKQKSKVLDNLRDLNVDSHWYSGDFDNFKSILNFLGYSDVKIDFSGFCSQGDGLSFTANFKKNKTKKELIERKKECLKNHPYFKKELENFLTIKFSKDEILEGENENIYRISHHYCHYNTVTCDNESLRLFSRELMAYFYKSLEKQYNFLTSDEAIKETILANGYEFDKDTLKLA